MFFILLFFYLYPFICPLIRGMEGGGAKGHSEREFLIFIIGFPNFSAVTFFSFLKPYMWVIFPYNYKISLKKEKIRLNLAVKKIL